MRPAWWVLVAVSALASSSDAADSRRQLKRAQATSASAAVGSGVESSRAQSAAAFENARPRPDADDLDIQRMPDGQARAREFAAPAAPTTAAPPPTAPTAPIKGKNVTRWQPLVMLAAALLAAAALLMLLATFLGRNAKKPGPDGLAAAKAAKMAAYVAAGIGGVVVLIGAMIAGMGQTGQGAIFALSGAAVGVLAYKAAEGYDQGSAEDITKNAAEAPISETGAKVSQTSVTPEGGNLELLKTEPAPKLELMMGEPVPKLELMMGEPVPKLEPMLGEPVPDLQLKMDPPSESLHLKH